MLPYFVLPNVLIHKFSRLYRDRQFQPLGAEVQMKTDSMIVKVKEKARAYLFTLQKAKQIRDENFKASSIDNLFLSIINYISLFFRINLIILAN